MFVLTILLLVAILILAVFIYGLSLLRGKRRKVGISILSLYALVIIHGVIYKQTPHGQIIRFIQGEGFAKQQVDNDAENLRNSPSLEKIHQWAIDTMLKFRSGELKSAGNASYWSLGSELVPEAEIPQFIRNLWTDEDPAEVSIGHGYTGSFIVIAWYGHGMVFGMKSFLLNLFPPDYQVIVSPSVYTYYLYK